VHQSRFVTYSPRLIQRLPTAFSIGHYHNLVNSGWTLLFLLLIQHIENANQPHQLVDGIHYIESS